MNPNISDPYVNQTSNKSSAFFNPSPYLPSHHISPEISGRPSADVFGNPFSPLTIQPKSAQSYRISQFGEVSQESAGKPEFDPLTEKVSPALSMKAAKGMRIRQKNEKNFRELNNSLANLALKRLIGKSSFDNQDTMNTGKGHMSDGIVMQEYGLEAHGSPDYYKSPHNLEPLNKPASCPKKLVQKEFTFASGSKYETKVRSNYIKPYYSIAAKHNQEAGFSMDSQGEARTQPTQRDYPQNKSIHNYNTLKVSPGGNMGLNNTTSSTSLYGKERKTFHTDTKYSKSRNESFPYDPHYLLTQRKRGVSPSDTGYLDKERFTSLDYGMKDTEKKQSHFYSVIETVETFETQGNETTDVKDYERRRSRDNRLSSPKGSFLVMRANQLSDENYKGSGPHIGPKNVNTRAKRHKTACWNPKENNSYGRLEQNCINEGVEYGKGGLGSYYTYYAEDDEKRNAKEMSRDAINMSATIREYNDSRVSLGPGSRVDLAHPNAVLGWKQDLLRIKEDMEQRKISYQELNEFVEKCEEEEEVLDKLENSTIQYQVYDNQLHKNTSVTSLGLELKKTHRKSARIFDPVPVATRLYKETMDMYTNQDWMVKEDKRCYEMKTTVTWDGQRSGLADNKEKRHKAKLNAKLYELTKGAKEFVTKDMNNVQPDNNPTTQCCGYDTGCNVF